MGAPPPPGLCPLLSIFFHSFAFQELSCDVIFKVPYYARCGTTFMGNEPSTKDACIVKKLRDGGAIIIGLSNMHELGVGTTGNNPNRLPFFRAGVYRCG